MQIKQDHIVIVLLTLLLAGFIALVASSTGSHGGEDSFMHYLFARYVPQHPENLLDHWAKPLLTLFLAPFAQFGYTGAKIYNCIAGILTAWFTYKTAQRLGLKSAMASIALLLFAPLFFLCINSALTEVTFAFVLSAGIYLIISNKYLGAAIVLSFLPFARTEGFIILPIIGLFYLWQKRYTAFFFLGLGLVLYSIVGFFHYDDLLWVFTKNPYAGRNGVYGNGNFWHFLDSYRDIIGQPQKWLFIIGLLSFFLALNKTAKAGFANANETSKHWLLIIACASAYFFAHSTVWYYGIQGSAGLTRVMAGILPLLILVSNRGIEAIYKRIPATLKNIKLAVVFTILFFVVEYPLQRYKLPIQLGSEETMLYKAGDWYKTTKYYETKPKVYYFAPTVGIAFDIDPFDFNQRDFLHNAKQSDVVPQGSIVVYDTHFGPLECEYPLEDIKGNPNYKLLKEFAYPPNESNGYSVYIFEKK